MTPTLDDLRATLERHQEQLELAAKTLEAFTGDPRNNRARDVRAAASTLLDQAARVEEGGARERVLGALASRNAYDKHKLSERVEALEGALVDAAAHLAAAISLLERSPKIAAPSNKMWDLMLSDYRASLERARQALASTTPPAKDGWLTIESAPRDGTKLWAFQSGREPFVVWRAESLLDGEYWQDEADDEPEPTHWQPLPAPPAIREAE